MVGHDAGSPTVQMKEVYEQMKAVRLGDRVQALEEKTSLEIALVNQDPLTVEFLLGGARMFAQVCHHALMNRQVFDLCFRRHILDDLTEFSGPFYPNMIWIFSNWREREECNPCICS
jgi:hypothetical protein